ncbi:MAG: CHAT domain-containing protein [Iphinoe sp. HA4291-MV1]|nr:CHAT domain-containing protein [Iphinoe sp. HA4291-MV1]
MSYLAKQFSLLKRSLLNSVSRRVILFVLAFVFFSKIAIGFATQAWAIAQQQGSSLSTRLENLTLPQANLTNLNFLAQGSSVKSPKQPPTSSQYVQSKDKPEPKVLVAEVVVTGVEGKLRHKVYETIQTKPGRISTHSLLKKDINAIFAIGYFSNVKAVPEDTPLGVRVTFEVKPNPILKLVNINSQILPQKVIKEAFQDQYESILNLVTLQEGMKKIKKWYLDNGYVLAQFVDTPQVSDDGTVTLEVAEGVVEDIQAQYVKFLNGRSFNSWNGMTIHGQTPKLLIIQDFRLKRGEVFNINQVRKEIKRIKKSRDFNQMTISLYPGIDPKKVVIGINVEEKDALVRLKENLQNENLQNENLQIQSLSPDEPVESAEKIIANYQERIRIARLINDIKLEVESLHSLGGIYKNLGKYSQSIDTYHKVLNLVRPQKQISTTLGNENQKNEKCHIFTRSTESIKYCSQRELEPGDKFWVEVNVLLSLGNTYRFIGEYQQALTLNHQALSLVHAVEAHYKNDDNKENMAILKAIITIVKSFVYSDLGESELAYDYVNQGQKLLTDFWAKIVEEDKKSDAEEEINSELMLNLFNSFVPFIFNQEDKQLISSLTEQWLNILKNLKKPQPDGSVLFQQIESILFEEFLSLSLYSIGKTYNQLGDKQKALEIYYQIVSRLKSLQISEIKPESEEQIKDVNEFKVALDFFARQIKAQIFNDIGGILAEFGKLQEALEAYQQALKLAQINGEISIQASVHDAIGKVYHGLKQHQMALDSYNQALIIWSKLGNQLAEANTRLGIASVERDRNRLYSAKIQIETAIRLIEREPLPNDADSSQSPTDEQRQFRYYISLASYFSAKQNYYDFYVDLLMLLHKKFPSHGYMVQAFQANEQSKNRSLLAILNRRDRYVSNAKTPNFFDTRYKNLADVPNLSTIQQQVLDDDSILLEYALGEERSYLWVVSKTGISSYELPKRAEIEAAARKFYDFMTVPSLRIRTNKAGKAGNELSQILLRQVASHLGNKRLLVVADGILQYIPFPALPDFNSDFTKPLLVNHEIVTFPSASTFAVLRNDNKNSTLPTKTLAVLADPVFGHEDERLGDKPIKPNLQTKQRSLVGNYQPTDSLFAEQLFPRLPSTRNEAEQIASLVNPISQIQKFGFSASRQTVLELELSQYRIIHFATHGILDAEKPERSGMLLSVVDQQGELQRSLLSTPDVFNLQLSADLVVLSGCRTGLGKQIKGEGLIGLTGGLMYAGAERVVVSLWSVDDQATAALMSRFYQGILKENLSPAKALREAQLTILQQSRWQNPYYWAAFTLQGEWK